jgi:hypothetical protein
MISESVPLYPTPVNGTDNFIGVFKNKQLYGFRKPIHTDVPNVSRIVIEGIQYRLPLREPLWLC